jgi:galactose oxidase
MCGQGCPSQRPENQFVNRLVFNGLRRRFQAWTITIGWLIGIVALFGAPAGAQAPTAGITANPRSIASGGSTTLTWTSTNAVRADLNGTPVPLNESEVVSPTATTAHRFTARNSSGAYGEGTVTVTVSSGSSDPSISGQWTPVQTWPFMAAHAHLLPNGQVLFWPSFALGNNPTLWNPVTNTFSTLPPAAYNIFCSGHSFLPDGTLLVTGGHNGSSGYGYPYASIYDPVKNAWTQTSNMSDARWYPTNTTLANGDVLVVSGEIAPGVYNTLPQIWHSANASWINLSSAQAQLPLYPMMFVAPNGQVFNAGPNRYTWYLNTGGTGAWASVAQFNYNGTRDYGSAVIFDGKVLIAGGDGSGNSAATATAEIIDLNAASPSWQFTSSMANPRRQHNLTLLPDGKVLATGGSIGYGFDNATYPVYAVEMWDPATGNWTAMANITVYRGYHSTALLLPDGRVLSAGGEQTGASAEIYSPPYLFKGARPSITLAPSRVKYGQTFVVVTPDAASIGQVTWIRLGSVTHSFNQNQRLNHLPFAQVSGGLKITAPASGKLAPPGHYLLFLVNSNGVPSVARIIKITN